jgi:hypothetical protein
MMASLVQYLVKNTIGMLEDCQGELNQAFKTFNHKEIKHCRYIFNAQIVGEQSQEPPGREVFRVNTFFNQQGVQRREISLDERIQLKA